MNASNNLTVQLKALLAGGAAAIALGQQVQAAALPATEHSDIEARIEKIRECLLKPDSGIIEGRGPAAVSPDTMWWRNAWGNGGWHNWHNSWHNWHNGGWGNWHNF